MVRHHIVISGTGRAGTTFLVQLLTDLNMDTGYPSPSAVIHSHCNAGLEGDIRSPDAPYIVKSPWMCDYLDDVLEQGEIIVDHAIVPVRDLYSAAESRRDVVRRVDIDKFSGPDKVPGGLWHTTQIEAQEMVLTAQLYKLIYALARHDVPLTLLYFPRLVYEPEYLYRKLSFLMDDIDYHHFNQIFEKVCRPELVHDFTQSQEEKA